jgi:hypothetical protein
MGLAFRIAKLFNGKIEGLFEYEGTSGEFRGLQLDTWCFW